MNDDFDSTQLDPGIQLLVLLLRAQGFETTDSGDGVSKFEGLGAGEEDGFPGSCAEAAPNVYMEVDPARMVEEAHRLHDLLLKRLRPGIFDEMIVGPGLDQPYPRVLLEVSYSPLDQSALLALHGVADADLRDAGEVFS